MPERQAGGGGGVPEAEDAYEPPAIAWQEPYEPVGFGISCARLEGQFDCIQGGPTFS